MKTTLSILVVIALWFVLGGPGIAKADYAPTAYDALWQCRIFSEFVTGKAIPWYIQLNDPRVKTGYPPKGSVFIEWDRIYSQRGHVGVVVSEVVDNHVFIIEAGAGVVQVRKMNLLDVSYVGYYDVNDLPDREWKL